MDMMTVLTVIGTICAVIGLVVACIAIYPLFMNFVTYLKRNGNPEIHVENRTDAYFGLTDMKVTHLISFSKSIKLMKYTFNGAGCVGYDLYVCRENGPNIKLKEESAIQKNDKIMVVSHWTKKDTFSITLEIEKSLKPITIYGDACRTEDDPKPLRDY